MVPRHAAAADVQVGGDETALYFDLARDGLEEESLAKAEMRAWLENLGLVQYSDVFVTEGLDDMRIIKSLEPQDIEDIAMLCGMPRFHHRQLQRGISQLQSGDSCAPALESQELQFQQFAAHSGAVPSQGEVFFSDPRSSAPSCTAPLQEDADFSNAAGRSSGAQRPEACGAAEEVADSAQAVANKESKASIASALSSSFLEANGVGQDTGPACGSFVLGSSEPVEADEADAEIDVEDCETSLASVGASALDRSSGAKGAGVACRGLSMESSEHAEASEATAGVDAKDAQTWEVVGGEHTGGILVRTEQDLKSPEAVPPRLAFGAIVKEVTLVAGRLHFELISGHGPTSGWVTTKLPDKDLLVRQSSSGASFAQQEQSAASALTTRIDEKSDMANDPSAENPAGEGAEVVSSSSSDVVGKHPTAGPPLSAISGQSRAPGPLAFRSRPLFSRPAQLPSAFDKAQAKASPSVGKSSVALSDPILLTSLFRDFKETPLPAHRSVAFSAPLQMPATRAIASNIGSKGKGASRPWGSKAADGALASKGGKGFKGLKGSTNVPSNEARKLMTPPIGAIDGSSGKLAGTKSLVYRPATESAS